MSKNKITKRLKSKIIKYYQSGITIRNICKLLNISSFTLYKTLNAHNINKRGHRILKHEQIEFIKQNLKFLGPFKLSKQLNVKIGIIEYIQRKYNLKYDPYKCEFGFKICRKCKNKKILEEFGKNISKKDGYKFRCKKCIAEGARKYRSNNKEKMRNKEKFKRKNDSKFRLISQIRHRIYISLKNNIKFINSREVLGCTIDFLKIYLEDQFKSGMTWENYGPVWHIDHIRPCASFDLSKEEEQRKCFHYSNLQPLWATTEIARQFGDMESIGNCNKHAKF